MGKLRLKLDLEDLAVESFTTAEPERQRGTVHGHLESAALSDCCYSQRCTGDPRDFQCLNTKNYCFETQQEGCSFYCL